MEKESIQPETNTPDNKKIEIEINKYKHFVEAINNPKMLSKLIIVVSIITILVFVGISAVAIIMKSFYPYKAIETNMYGATVIRSEDTEVTYWLYNSADLWANSGIEVKAGQTLSIRTSGASHTAIHRLVQDANSNKTMKIKWQHPRGGKNSRKEDTTRMAYRIAPNYEQHAILMQVLPKEFDTYGNEWYENVDPTEWDYIDGGGKSKNKKNESTKAHIYKIGEGQDNIEIQEDGILYFSCNDIALTPRVIDSLLAHQDKTNPSEKFGDPKEMKKKGETEFDYYKQKKFINAWFVDNVGSYLIVIERKKK